MANLGILFFSFCWSAVIFDVKCQLQLPLRGFDAATKTDAEIAASLIGRIKCDDESIHNGKCFRFIKEGAIHNLAQMHCMLHGERLASPISKEEEDFMIKFVKKKKAEDTTLEAKFLTDFMWTGPQAGGGKYITLFKNKDGNAKYANYDYSVQGGGDDLSLVVDSAAAPDAQHKWEKANTYTKYPYFCVSEIEQHESSNTGFDHQDNKQVEFGPTVCAKGSFPCPGGQQGCIHGAQVCDGVNDCSDGSDEMACKDTVCEQMKLGANMTVSTRVEKRLDDRASCIRGLKLVHADKDMNPSKEECVWGLSYYFYGETVVTEYGCRGTFSVCYVPKECYYGWTAFKGRCYRLLDMQTDLWHAQRLCHAHDGEGKEIPHLLAPELPTTGYTDYGYSSGYDYSGYGGYGNGYGAYDYGYESGYGGYGNGYGTGYGSGYGDYSYGDYTNFYYYSGSGDDSNYYGSGYSGMYTGSGGSGFSYYYGWNDYSNYSSSWGSGGDYTFGDYWGATFLNDSKYQNASDYYNWHSNTFGSGSGDYYYNDYSGMGGYGGYSGYGYGGSPSYMDYYDHSELVLPKDYQEYEFLIHLAKKSAGSGCAPMDQLEGTGFWINTEYEGNRTYLPYEHFKDNERPACDEYCQFYTSVCLYVDVGDGYMDDRSCHLPMFAPICVYENKRSPVTKPHRPDCDGEIVGFYCFELISKRENWKTAKKICSEGGRRGFLAEVLTPVEGAAIERLRTTRIAHGRYWRIWIGGYEVSEQGGEWEWTNSGESIPMSDAEGFHMWRKHEPNRPGQQHCLQWQKLKDGGHWVDDYCKSKKSFVCQYPLDTGSLDYASGGSAVHAAVVMVASSIMAAVVMATVM